MIILQALSSFLPTMLATGVLAGVAIVVAIYAFVMYLNGDWDSTKAIVVTAGAAVILGILLMGFTTVPTAVNCNSSGVCAPTGFIRNPYTPIIFIGLIVTVILIVAILLLDLVT